MPENAATQISTPVADPAIATLIESVVSAGAAYHSSLDVLDISARTPADVSAVPDASVTDATTVPSHVVTATISKSPAVTGAIAIVAPIPLPVCDADPTSLGGAGGAAASIAVASLASIRPSKPSRPHDAATTTIAIVRETATIRYYRASVSVRDARRR
jgi:hypothetical protein